MGIQESLSHQTPAQFRIADIESLREAAKSFASEIQRLTQPSREQSLANTKLEESLMWAVKSIVLEKT